MIGDYLSPSDRWRKSFQPLYDREIVTPTQVCEVRFFQTPINSHFQFKYQERKGCGDTNLYQSNQLTQPLSFLASGISITYSGEQSQIDLIKQSGFFELSKSGRPIFQSSTQLIPAYPMRILDKIPPIVARIFGLKQAKILRLSGDDAQATLLEMAAFSEFPFLANDFDAMEEILESIFDGFGAAPIHWRNPIGIEATESFSAKIVFDKPITLESDVSILVAIHGEMCEPS